MYDTLQASTSIRTQKQEERLEHFDWKRWIHGSAAFPKDIL